MTGPKLKDCRHSLQEIPGPAIDASRALPCKCSSLDQAEAVQVSMLHVTQLDRIVDVVEETSRGRVVTLLVSRHSFRLVCRVGASRILLRVVPPASASKRGVDVAVGSRDLHYG